MTKNLTLQAPTLSDMNEWIKSLRLHQIDLFRSRSTIFDQWLSKMGVKVSGGPSDEVKTSQFIEDAVKDEEVKEVLMHESNDQIPEDKQ